MKISHRYRLLPAIIVLGAAPVALAGASLAACTSNVTVLQYADGGPGGEGGLPIGELDDASTRADALPGVDASSPSSETNPDGVPYPTQHIGTSVRTGMKPGSVIANLKLTGYAPNASTTSQVKLADVFDPKGYTHDIVALLLQTTWDAPSKNMMKSLAAAAPSRVAIIAVLGEGTSPGQPATLGDLTAWHAASSFPAAWSVLDPSFSQLPPPLSGNAVPMIIVLDARTMEIVSAEAGAPPNPKQALEAARDSVKSRLPAY
jgi:hypothetical protein